MFFQPFLQFGADDALNHRTHFGGNQLVLGLGRELRIRHFDGKHAGQTFAHVFAGDQVLVFFQKVVFRNIVVDGTGQRGTETGQMGTAVFLRNVVGKAEHAFIVGVGPLQRRFDLNVTVAVGAGKSDNAFVQRRFRLVDVVDERGQAAFIMHNRFPRLAAPVVDQFEINAGIEERLFADASFQRVEIKFGHGKGFRRRQEGHFRSVAAVGVADNFQMLDHVAVGKGNHMLVPFAPDAQFKPGGKRVDDGNADPVQTARNLVGIVVELAARVQLGHNHFRRGNAFFLVHAYRNAATVVADGGGTVGIEDDFGFVAIAGERLVDRVVQHFVNHVVKAGAVIGVADIHARAFANRVQPAQDFDRIGIVFLFFPVDFGLCHVYHK